MPVDMTRAILPLYLYEIDAGSLLIVKSHVSPGRITRGAGLDNSTRAPEIEIFVIAPLYVASE